MKPRFKLRLDGTLVFVGKSPEQVRSEMLFRGITIAQWSRENNVHHSLVREILAGRKKCMRGMSRNIAVLLGMKEGLITTRPGRVAPAGRLIEPRLVGAQA
ncbi:gp16 family phage-associated protein [Paucibacter oligotrophus]|uniref:Gp16 family phage-associated protein n=1 Tax=Roseateles oligotrophus TaxID=1769250 RepID=A0A840LA54_9BURK|nr:DNA-binding protein [Roseateles oligotrophus]MBB4845006.1 gp16 family phage-associated protein [Roseateles oligotrophus]